MWLFIAVSVLFLILLIAYGLVSYARWNFGRLEKQGIPVVGPNHYLLGGALLSYEKCGGLLDIDNMKKYGDFFGLYEGREAHVYICDAELIRLITTKDSAHFEGKRNFDFGDPLLNEFVDWQPYKKWKTIRNLISPPLNSLVRLKNSGGAMQQATQDYINDLKQQIRKNGGKLEKYDLDGGLFEMLTDLIARSQLGINIGKSESSKRFGKCIQLLTHPPPAAETNWLVTQASTFCYAFSFLKRFIPNTTNSQCTREFVHLFKQMINLRREQNKASGTRAQGRERDFLDFLLEWLDDLESNAELKKVGISELTIYNLGLSMFMAAQDQISLILSAMMVCVVENSEIERKLREEVDQAWTKSGGVFDHETVSEMEYLNACILEAARLYPFFFRGERICTMDWEDKERGIKIRKGDVVQIALWAANRNPKYFEEPDKFKPERFMPGNKEKMHAYAFTSFGFGPRNCVGRRLAMEIMGILAAYLMKEFRFVKRVDTGLNFLPAGPFLAAHEPILFDVEVC